ncbi:hypothetical protein ECHHL_0710 [Ehrlichia chaffeensis str. Heartland]|nr:hypothetical protein [Ehrlichia chaffeensis]AHX03857.1 hypothetical protein ECHHL_0710 [Ehrlichia chaffeensis str. Heartland]AHX05417.1 hypothetical protein ECHJAX_0342 [Ehrlichia chaffeensis str. Jax]AHX06405.1 hypothetical protein ECHLIB_0339 [Ehrlichia chaffeensis str. Liberty]AHX10817.1 hypothetical protein ECHWP_0706 [Ehrlichia chaffeensis str. West Paces]
MVTDVVNYTSNNNLYAGEFYVDQEFVKYNEHRKSIGNVIKIY